MERAIPTFELFGVPLAKVRATELLDWMFSGPGVSVRTVAFVSLNEIFVTNLNRQFAGLYDDFDRVVNDGRNVVRFVRLLGGSLPEQRIAGMDVFPEVVRRAGREQRTAYVVAPSEAIFERLAERAEAVYGCDRSRLVGHGVPPFRPWFQASDLASVIAEIDVLCPDFVWVGIGSPKQETIARVLQQELKVATPTIMCIGGAMETTAGVIPIGPGWLRNAGLESFYRAYKQPRKHARRYLLYNTVVVWFAVRALWERLTRGARN